MFRRSAVPHINGPNCERLDGEVHDAMYARHAFIRGVIVVGDAYAFVFGELF